MRQDRVFCLSVYISAIPAVAVGQLAPKSRLAFCHSCWLMPRFFCSVPPASCGLMCSVTFYTFSLGIRSFEVIRLACFNSN